MKIRPYESEAAVIDDVFRPMATGRRSIRRTLLALVVLGGALLLALSHEPAEAATTFTVTETGDDADINFSNDRCDSSTATGDQCTLRAAIEEANDTAGDDTVDFDIGGSGSGETISVATALPSITETLTIDGYTQTGASPNASDVGDDAILNVVLGGLGAGANSNGLEIDAPDCTIKGLVIKNFGGAGVEISGADAIGNHIEGNFIGIDRDGITDRGNNYGVSIEGDSSTVGGTEPESRNIISGNDRSGVFISGATDNMVEGNLVGTTADGEGELGNGFGMHIDSADNMIGGTVSGARNVISGNIAYGIFIGPAATDTRIEGNYVGVAADGEDDLGNDSHGMYIQGDSNTVGGRVAGARNVISGNDGFGVFVSGLSGGNENRIEGNYIGTTADGKGDLGNTRGGVTIQNGPDFTAVGGTLPGAPNRIAHNGEDGVAVVDNGNATGNNILSNRIYDNDDLGIDLEGGTEDPDGVTSSDTGDLDTGSNNLQNFPTIVSARKTIPTGQTTISGRLNSNSAQDFVVQCFLTGGAPASDHGEGSRLLDTVPISTNANGRASFICESSRTLLGLQPGQTVTATATNVATGDTSEFSKNKTITFGP